MPTNPNARVASIAVVVAAALSSSCDGERACTLVGCNSQLVIEAPALDDAAFTVLFESNEITGTVTCPAADDTGFRGIAIDATGDIAREADESSAASVVAFCNEDGVALSAFRSDVDPADVFPTNVTVTFTNTDGATTFSASDDDLAYDVSQPNGPDCEPTCLQGTLLVQ